MTSVSEIGHIDSDVPWFVVGDVHLHRGVRPDVIRDLARWVREVSARAPNAVIVFNGDLFDLDRLRGQRRYGLGSGRVVERLQEILDLTGEWVQHTRAHVRGGGRVVFIAGNHDAELLLPEVTACLQENFGVHPGRVSVVERLEHGGFLILHGHQVDPDARFFPDTATAVAKQRLSAFPLACVVTRVLLSRIPRFELTDDNHRKPVHVFSRVLKDYKMGALRMIVVYPFAAVEVVIHSLLARWREDVPAGGDVSSMSSPMSVASRLYVDRYLATAAVVASVLLWLLVGGRRFGWAIAGLGAYLVVPPARLKKYARRDVRKCDEHVEKLSEQGIQGVVCGHVHRAFVRDSSGGAVYGNHGAFSSSYRAREVLDEPGLASSGVDPDEQVRTFLVLDWSEQRLRLEGLAVGR